MKKGVIGISIIKPLPKELGDAVKNDIERTSINLGLIEECKVIIKRLFYLYLQYKLERM